MLVIVGDGGEVVAALVSEFFLDLVIVVVAVLAVLFVVCCLFVACWLLFPLLLLLSLLLLFFVADCLYGW